METRDLRVTQNVYFSLLTHTNQLLLVTLCHTPAGIGNSKVGRDADAAAAADDHADDHADADGSTDRREG